MFHIFKLLVLMVLLTSPLSSFETDNERENKWKFSSWIKPLKIGLIGGLLYSSTKNLRPVFVFADSGSHFTPMIPNEGYDRFPYDRLPLMVHPLIVPENPISEISLMDLSTCLYGKAIGCRKFHVQGENRGWGLPGRVKQEQIPGYLNTPILQQVEHDDGINFTPLNTAFRTNTRGTNVNFRQNVKNFTPSRPGSSRTTEPGINLDGNNLNVTPSSPAVNPFPNTPYINDGRQNSSTLVSFRNVLMQDPRRYLTILSNTSTDSLESTPKPS